MDRKASEVAKFLLDWNNLLIAEPVNGSITQIYFCFIVSSYSKGRDRVSWQQFIKYLDLLDKIGGSHVFGCRPQNALELVYENPFSCFNHITYINRMALALILKTDKLMTRSDSTDSIVKELKSTHHSVAPITDKVHQFQLVKKLIDGNSDDNNSQKRTWKVIETLPQKILHSTKITASDASDLYRITSKSGRLEQLEVLLKSECSSHKLLRERAKDMTIELPFYDCCENFDHATQLSQVTEFDRDTSTSVLKKGTVLPNGLLKCVNEKMHFIPVIQPQTDMKLGDCSYLDTCHKMRTCRYVHYGLLLPQTQVKNSTNDEVGEQRKRIGNLLRSSLFTRGEPINSASIEELPAQWICCDVMQLDFDILGNNWAVVLADPSWTIHMNLNYSSMKDDDLLSLPMDKLQKEGLYLLWVTGRTIEMGRTFLKKWGYKVVNQLTWVKTSQLVRTISTGRTGHWLNHSKEHLLVGMKGNPKWLSKGVDPQLLVSSTRETSRKPDEIYGIIERLVGPRVKKLEIFGRQHNTRPGWVTIGNQLEGTHLLEEELSWRYDKWLGSRRIQKSRA